MHKQSVAERQTLDLPSLGRTVVIRSLSPQELLLVHAMAHQEGELSPERLMLGTLKAGLVEPELSWREARRFKNRRPTEAARIAAAISGLSEGRAS